MKVGSNQSLGPGSPHTAPGAPNGVANGVATAHKCECKCCDH